MAQIWDPQAYEKDGAFVPALASGVLEWLDARPGERILDLGCGDGKLTQKIAATGASVTGVDSSPEMVEAARARDIAAEVGDAEALPFADGCFDAVFSNAALHWVRDQDAMMEQVHRVLRPGGRFVAEMGGHGNIAAIRVAFSAVLERNGFGDREGDANYYPTPEEFTRRLELHGFTMARMALIPRPTRLEKGGMTGWLRTFRRGALESLPEDARARIVEDTAGLLAPVLRDSEGNWTADYVRLRFEAKKG